MINHFLTRNRSFAYQSLESGRQLLLQRNRILTGERVQMQFWL